MHLEIENIHHPQIKNMNLSVYDVGYRAAHLHPENFICKSYPENALFVF